MKSKKLGSCLCGNIKYEFEGEFENFFLCHCQYCQKDTGSAHAANLFSTKLKFNWLSGENDVKTFHLPNTRHVKSFCTHCGSATPTLLKDGKLVIIPAGSLDMDIDYQPKAHLFIASKAEWEKDLENIPSFEGFPS